MAGEVFIEGESYSLSSLTEWLTVNPRCGDILEAELLSSSFEGVTEETWVPFLVIQSTLGPAGGLTVQVKSVGARDQDLSKRLSQQYNRRVGYLHLCSTVPCGEAGSGDLHVSKLRWFSAEGYASFLSAAQNRQVQKWIEGYVAAVEVEAAELDKHGGEGKEAEPDDDSKKKPEREKRDAGKGDKSGTKVDSKKIEDLRERLRVAKEKMTARGHTGALGPGTQKDSSSTDSSSSSSSSDSEGSGSEERKRKLAGALTQVGMCLPSGSREHSSKTYAKALIERARETMEKKPAPGGMLSLLQNQLQVSKEAEKKKEDETPQDSGKQKKKEKKKKQKPGGDPPSSSSSQGSQKGKKKKKGASKKKKKKKKKSAKKKKKKKAKKAKKHGKTKRYRSSSGSSSSRTSDGSDLSMEAPLRKKSREEPGSVLALLVEHVRSQLEQSAEVEVESQGKSGILSGVKMLTFLSLHIKPQFGGYTRELRELYLLGTASTN